MAEKRTKIVCTVGPSSESQQTLARMLRAGMNVARLNFSHGTYAHHSLLIRNMRAAARRGGKTVAILQDLQGPKIRVGELPDRGVVLRRGASVVLSTVLRRSADGIIPVQYARLHRDVRRGDRLLLDDGRLELRVRAVRGRSIHTTVVIGGTLISYKGINVPTAALSASPLTAKDLRDLHFGLAQDVDFVALSFVRKAADVERLRRLIRQYARRSLGGGGRGTLPQVIVKIERREALRNLDDIIAAADGIMVARGDLALEADAASVPLYQKTTIRKCLEAAKPVIIATEMLGSMVEHPRPTRAEVSDVANAVIDHTDATMLSAETATGRYPVRAVETMAHVIRDTEASTLDDLVLPPRVSADERPVVAVSAAACRLAAEVRAAAIVAVTISGFTARSISRHRPPQPIVAVTADPGVARRLALSWGVTPVLRKGSDDPDAVRRWSVRHLRVMLGVRRGDRVVFVAGLRVDRTPRWEEAVRVVEV